MSTASRRLALYNALVRARDLAHPLVSDDAPAIARELGSTIADAFYRACDLVPSFALSPDLASDLVCDLDRACDLASDLASAPVGAFGLVLARDVASDHALARALALYNALVRARDLACDLARASGQPRAKRVTPSAAMLLAAVTRLLPATDRARYTEEYGSELWDLAQAGNGRLRQLAYALRQLRSALPTSFALRTPRRRSAAP